MLAKLADPITCRWVVLWDGRANNDAMKRSCSTASIMAEDACHTVCTIGRYADDRDGSVFVSTVEHIVDLHNATLTEMRSLDAEATGSRA